MWVFIHRAIFKKERLHLSIVPKPNPVTDEFYYYSTDCTDVSDTVQQCMLQYVCVCIQTQWPLVDPFTGAAPSHDFLTSLDAVNALSLWDLTIPFR